MSSILIASTIRFYGDLLSGTMENRTFSKKCWYSNRPFNFDVMLVWSDYSKIKNYVVAFEMRYKCSRGLNSKPKIPYTMFECQAKGSVSALENALRCRLTACLEKRSYMSQ